MKKKLKVAGIGELLWDVLPDGKQLGGAPFNFAYHSSQMGCDAYIISAVGKDDLGKEIIANINQLGINCQYLQKNKYPTSTVTVELDKNGQPKYTIQEDVAWDYIEWSNEIKKFAYDFDAVCFGSLAQRSPISAQTIHSFLGELKQDCLKVFDVNLRQNYFNKTIIIESLGVADMLKLNDEELSIIARYIKLKGDVKTQLEELINNFELKYIAFTKGSEGSTLMSLDDYSECKAPKIKVVDTVGAGDAFTAVLVTGLLKKRPLQQIHEKATEVAAFVCSQKGATPQIPKINLFN